MNKQNYDCVKILNVKAICMSFRKLQLWIVTILLKEFHLIITFNVKQIKRNLHGRRKNEMRKIKFRGKRVDDKELVYGGNRFYSYEDGYRYLYTEYK